MQQKTDITNNTTTHHWADFLWRIGPFYLPTWTWWLDIWWCCSYYLRLCGSLLHIDGLRILLFMYYRGCITLLTRYYNPRQYLFTVQYLLYYKEGPFMMTPSMFFLILCLLFYGLGFLAGRIYIFSYYKIIS